MIPHITSNHHGFIWQNLLRDPISMHFHPFGILWFIFFWGGGTYLTQSSYSKVFILIFLVRYMIIVPQSTQSHGARNCSFCVAQLLAILYGDSEDDRPQIWVRTKHTSITSFEPSQCQSLPQTETLKLVLLARFGWCVSQILWNLEGQHPPACFASQDMF